MQINQEVEMMKKLIPLLAAGLVLCLCACGGSGSGDSGKAAAAAEKSTVQFWHCMGAAMGQRIDAMVARFNQSQDKVTVVATYQGSYEECNAKLQTALAGGTAPDLIQMEQGFIEPYAASHFADFTPYFNRDKIPVSMFSQGLMGVSYFNNNNKLVAIPISRSTPILYYNKDWFKAAGLDPEKGPQDWNDIYEYGRKLLGVKYNKSGNTQYAITFPINSWHVEAGVQSLGSRAINTQKNGIGFYDDGTGVKVFNHWIKMRDEGLLYVTPVTNGPSIATQAFINGEVAMLQHTTSQTGNILDKGNFELGACYVPKAPGGVTVVPTGGSNMAILEKSKVKDATWEFVKWMITDPNGALPFVVESGYLPFTDEMAKSEYYQEFCIKNIAYQVAYDQIQYSLDTNHHLYWAELKNEIIATAQAIMNDNQDPQKMLERLNQRSKEILTQ